MYVYLVDAEKVPRGDFAHVLSVDWTREYFYSVTT